MKNIRRNILCNALIIAIGLAGAASNAQAQAAGDTKDFDVPAQSAASALNAFAEQADITLVFSQDRVQGITTHPLHGSYTASEGLAAMLEGTGLAIRKINYNTISIGAGTPVDEDEESVERKKESATTLDAVTVTGTRIRGGVTPSPVITIGSERIREEGFTDIGEVVRSIPQNFTGGQNPGVSSGGFSGAGLANQNITGGSSLNLRGLGPDATLTLLNGRRMVYSGFAQAVDISAIPVEAVERVEIVADGASAIYGSDAVGGVGNVILKRDFDGVTVSTRHGGATDGGLATHEYGVTAGTYWNSGGLIATYRDVSVDPIHAAERRYADYLGPPTTLYPGSDLRSGLLSAYQVLGESVELRLDALGSRRHQRHYYEYLGVNSMTPRTTTLLVSPSIEFTLPRDWALSLAATWGRDRHDEHQARLDPATDASRILVNDCYCNESRTYEVGVEGPVFELPGGEVRLASGTGYRKNRFWQDSYTTGTRSNRGMESARFAYAEIDVPVIGAGQNIPGVKQLSLTAAVRSEGYSSFGGVTTPKVGLVYRPGNDFTAKASWGRSFKAPTLLQVNQSRVASLGFPASWGGTGYPAGSMAVRVGGGNPDLKPERAQTWTASLAYHPEALPGLETELTGFHIDYIDRVVQPIVNYSQVLGNPAYAQVVDYQPSAAKLEQLLSTVSFYNFTGVPYDPAKVVAIVYGNYTNIAQQKIRGADLSGSYRFDLGSGRLTLRGSVTWMDSSQRNTATQDSFDLSGTLFNPAKVTSRVGAVWNQGGFSASVFGNYKSGVTNTVDRKKTTSFTTFDAALRYAHDRRDGIWAGVAVALSVQNLLDRAPPLYTPSSYADYAPPYDSTNYSATGRFIDLSVSKHF